MAVWSIYSPLGRSGCDEGECSGECAVMVAVTECGGWVVVGGRSVCLHVKVCDMGDAAMRAR